MLLAADAMHAALHQLDAADSMGRPGATAPAGAPTRQQGPSLACISEYVAANRAGMAPSHADLQSLFNLTLPSVNSMLVRLERCGFIRRVPGKAFAFLEAHLLDTQHRVDEIATRDRCHATPLVGHAADSRRHLSRHFHGLPR